MTVDTGPRRWWWVADGAVLLAASGWVLATRWSAVFASHPVLPVTLLLAAAAGAALLALGIRGGPARPGRWWLVGRVTGTLAAVLVAGALAWLRPFAAVPAGSPGSAAVRVHSTATTITLRPPAGAATTGLVFYPGARVDPRAYTPILRKVAAAGYLVVIVKPPYNLAVLGPNAASGVLDAHPEIAHWVVGGHSLGGTVAAGYARGHTRIAGLLLWASYPASSLAGRSGLAVTSVYGTRDGLATPAKVDAAKPKLPADTVYVPVEGAVHADFGDYGSQPGDGTPTISREQAQDEIVAASLSLLRRATLR